MPFVFPTPGMPRPNVTLLPAGPVFTFNTRTLFAGFVGDWNAYRSVMSVCTLPPGRRQSRRVEVIRRTCSGRPSFLNEECGERERSRRDGKRRDHEHPP